MNSVKETVLRKKEAVRSAPGRVAGKMAHVGSYVLYRPKYLYDDKSVQGRVIRTPCVIIANHTSAKDGPFLMSVLKGTPIVTLIAKDWYEDKRLHWFVSANACIPIDRTGQDISWVRSALAELRSGRSVLIFPEGSTHSDGVLGEFKSGFLLLSHMANVPILPVCLDAEYHVIGKRKRLMVGRPMRITPPAKGLNLEYFDAESERFRREILRLGERMRQGRSNH